MNINEKVYRKKSPEAIAYESTTAHYFLFYDKDMDYVIKHDQTQTAIEMELAAVAMEKMYEEDRAKKMSSYVS